MNHRSAQTTLPRKSHDDDPPDDGQTSVKAASRRERLPSSIILSLAIAFVHLGALLWIGLSFRDFIFGPLLNAPFILECRNSFIFGDNLVLPQFQLPGEKLMRLQFVSLKTGKTWYSKPTDIVWFHGLVSDGKQIWSFGNNDEVYETDGITSRTFTTNYKLSLKPGMNSGAFLYEGRPAIVDRVSDSLHRLLVMENDNWKEIAQVAYPGRGRKWILNAENGLRRLVPDFAVDVPAGGPRFSFTKTVAADGIFHQFQIGTINQDQSYRPTRYDVAYRRGFDFTHVTNSESELPRSALAPENVPPDTTGWELLGPQVSHTYDIVVHHGELFLADWDNVPKVYRIIPGAHFADTKQTEEIVLRESLPSAQERLTVGLIQSVDQQRLFAICQQRFGESTLFEWNGREFTPLPFKIDGILTTPLRLFGMYLAEVVVTLWIGTFLFAIGSQWLMNYTGESSYSFATETLPLASILRRSVARCIDLILIFAPITVQFGLLMFQTNSQTIFETINQRKFAYVQQYLLGHFARTGGWSLLAGCLFVFLSGRYGITPGKYLCGIRVIRTTLQPCGIARSLVRELLFYLEVPMLLTAVPALGFCLGTACRQRLGDLVADTIVVAAKERNSC